MAAAVPPVKGRGATFNPANRFRREQREAVEDGWEVPGVAPDDEDAPPPLKTVVRILPARTIISRNDSPDIPFTQSINPYQGCEHGCIYCYARPTHAYLDLSPGLDFETKLFAKPNAVGSAAQGAREARLSPRPDRARLQHRPVPADRAGVEDHARAHRESGRMRASDDDHHQGRVDRARPRPPRADGRQGARPRVRLDRDARPRARAEARPARRGAAPPARDRQGVERGRRARSASTSRRSFRSSRTTSSRRFSKRPRQPARGMPAGRCCGCRSRSRRSFATGSPRTTRCARRT